jgi:hypothetical protein
MSCPVCGEEHCRGNPVCGLKYIAQSPSREDGGFHENAIKTAKDALRLIDYLETRVQLMEAQQANADRYFAQCALERVRLAEELAAVRQISGHSRCW